MKKSSEVSHSKRGSMEEGNNFGNNYLQCGRTYILLFFLTIAAFMACLPQDAAAAWAKTIVDNSGDVGTCASTAIDSSGKVHISYIDFTGQYWVLKYATNATGTWVKTTIDSSQYFIAYGTSIGVDSNGKVHISYTDLYYGLAKYATNVSGNWVRTTVDNAGGQFTSLVVDSNNKLHISYFNSNNSNLKYATNASGSWGRRRLTVQQTISAFPR